MKLIAKKEFKNLIIGNETIFMGVSRELFDGWYIADVIDDYMVECDYIERRTATEKGKYIEFSGGSRLDINNNDFNKYTTYLYEYDSCLVLCCCNDYLDTCDNEWNKKCMYYLIEK